MTHSFPTRRSSDLNAAGPGGGKDRHLRSELKSHGGRCTSWSRGRLPGTQRVVYRLFRSDQRGAWHFLARDYDTSAPRARIAHELRLLKRQPRDRVDAPDLALMEATARITKIGKASCMERGCQYV